MQATGKTHPNGPRIGRAEIRVAGHTGVLVADACTVDADVVTASGRWRWRLGANHAELRYSAASVYSWPIREVREIRWTDSKVAA